jgi:hypothetical protein
MKCKLAVIIPVRNGGELLEASVLSCGRSSLTGQDAELLVLDNCSDDGAVDGLPSQVGSSSLPVRVIRNERDLGRVGNWNRGVELARERGFTFITFLFAGDTWLAGSAAAELLERMCSSGAQLGLAPYVTVSEQGKMLRRSNRVSFAGSGKLIESRELLRAMMRRGHLPITPLQANIYRLGPDKFPQFAEDRPLTTDMDATVEYLARRGGMVALTSRPFCAWLARKGRVFCTSGLESFMADHFRQLQYAESLSSCPVNWSKAKSVFLLGCLMNGITFTGWRSLPRVARSALLHASRAPGTINPVDVSALVLRRLVAGKSSLHLG